MTREQRKFINEIKKVYKISEIVFKNGKIILPGPKIGPNTSYYTAFNCNNLKNGKEWRKNFPTMKEAREFMQN